MIRSPEDITEAEKLKKIFAKNLNKYLGDTPQIEVANAIGVIPATFSSWCVGKNMPRMDKVQALADYFGVKKSDLIEEKPITNSDELSKNKQIVIEKIKTLDESQTEAVNKIVDSILAMREKGKD